MKATIESTDKVVVVNMARARVWEGVTEAGVPFVAYIAMVQVKNDADNSQFERELEQHKQPSAETVRAIDARFIL